jgi:hypothetical protein
VTRRWIAAAVTAAAILGGSAAAVSPAAASTTAAAAPRVVPAACGWSRVTVTHRPGFDVILWGYSCDTGRHCQVVSTGWRGKMTLQLIRNGVVVSSVTGYLIHSGDYLNTATVPAANQCGWDAQAFPL